MTSAGAMLIPNSLSPLRERNCRAAHAPSDLRGLSAAGSTCSPTPPRQRCVRTYKRRGGSSAWSPSEEGTCRRSKGQKLRLMLAEAELLLPSLHASVAQRRAALLKNLRNRRPRCRGILCKRNITVLPWLGFSSSVYSRLLLQFRLEMFLTSPGMFKTSLDKVQDRGTST